MVRATVLLLLLAPLAAAEEEPKDDLLPVTWKVDRHDGSVRFGAGGLKEPLFSATSGPFLREFTDGGLAASIRLFLPGPIDLASHADPELHFRRVGPLDDGALLSRLAEKPELEGPLGDRARLDLLLAVRLAADRNLLRAAPLLHELSRHDDPFLSVAAAQSLAVVRRERAPVERLGATDVLASIPTGSEIVVVLDCRRMPTWRGLAGFATKQGVGQVRATLQKYGAEPAPAQMGEAQKTIDRAAEWFYEAARRYGNMRFHRMAVGLTFARGASGLPGIHAAADGLFQPDRFAARFAAEKTTAELLDGNVTVLVPDHGLTFEVAKSRMNVRYGEITDEGNREAFLSELEREGARQAHLFVHLRRGVELPSQATLVPGVAGLKSATLKATFGEDALRASFQGEFANEATAERAAGALQALARSWKPNEQVTAVMEALRITNEGARLDITIELKGTTADDLVRALASALG